MLDTDFHGLPAWNWLLQAAGLCTSLWGTSMVAQLRRDGFAICIVSNLLLAALHALTGLWLLVLLDAGYFAINITRLRCWARTPPANARSEPQRSPAPPLPTQ